ncbi:endonuclease/exonuclease/phosphatase family protein [Eleftheria terrae]|uniref:endonuclease/exonuclease/phosphatase family protein n=1 Tax=Eleftheria terrae TaxID=1597781 RepID=UPI00263AB843|nr:endonuclease/exonuclease/phosphatase family protein [Eleftheria terrae]WKB52171.1 endonuclease/exonuclease/phosphatase family protein [Eleftheria terrae]
MGTNPLNSSVLPSGDATGATADDRLLRVATYNIHKGVRGMGPNRRLEIHNLGLGVEALDADLVFLQEVRSYHHLEARRFQRSSFGWPSQPQADFLAPEGYAVAYRTNAYTRGGEHGNALLSRWPIGDIGHHDVSDHRFEQRGLLHVPVHWQQVELHAIVAHFGLIHSSRVRQVERLAAFITANVPPQAPLVVAGDFNDWGEKLDGLMLDCGLVRGLAPHGKRPLTFPSRVPVFSLDRFYLRGMKCVSTFVPRGTSWARMSDHLPLVAELELG